MHHEKAEQDILVTQQVYQRAQSDLAGSRPQGVSVEGFSATDRALYGLSGLRMIDQSAPPS